TFGFTKAYASALPVDLEGGEISKDLHWYFGPTDVDTLSKYEDLGLDDSIPFGWGIFGMINRYVFTPFYGLLSTYFPYGIAIVIMTILVRLAMSPV
ncbi:MAG TPA: membrane protein insertase YidC, partial [Maribacter sp.]|nr:membrane protein insertase YidC [Maribacter sp.]